MSPPLADDGARTPPLLPPAVPPGWLGELSPVGGKEARQWTVGTLVDSCLTLDGIKDTLKVGGNPTPEEQDTLAAAAEEVTERLKAQLGKVVGKVAADAAEAAGGGDGGEAAAGGGAEALKKQEQEVKDLEEAAKGFGTQGSQRSEKTHGESYAANQQITKHAFTSP
jgi:hypothetical protein